MDKFPDWKQLTPKFAAKELPRLLEAAEAKVAALEASEPKGFEDLVWRLDDATRPLWDLWGMVRHLSSVMNSVAWRRVEEDFQPRLVAFSLRVGQSRRLYDLAKRVLKNLSKNPKSATRRRILEKSIEGAEHCGVGLDGRKKERFNAVAARLAELGTKFANSVIDATKAFSLKKGGKTYTIDDANYPETMRECPDREVRRRLYLARSSRAPENAARIDEILRLRTTSTAPPSSRRRRRRRNSRGSRASVSVSPADCVHGTVPLSRNACARRSTPIPRQSSSATSSSPRCWKGSSG